MQINKRKTIEMVMTDSYTVSVPLCPDIFRVKTFKLFSILVCIITCNSDIACMIHLTNSRLHFLKQLRKAAVSENDMLHCYIAVLFFGSWGRQFLSDSDILVLIQIELIKMKQQKSEHT